jgi:hypothetical protein
MPPHQAVLDVDCLDADMFDNHQPISPLFRDDNDNSSGHSSRNNSSGPAVPPVTSPSTPCRLLRRQANPEFAAVVAVCPSRERTISTEDYLSTSPPPSRKVVSRQSRITEIIGPESAYVKAASSSSSYVAGVSSLTHPSAPPTTLSNTITTDETKTIMPPLKSDTPPSSSEEEKEKKASPSIDVNVVGGSQQKQQQQPTPSIFRRFMPKLKRVKGVSLPIRSLVK